MDTQTQTSTQSLQTQAGGLQQPRNDLQPTGSDLQQGSLSGSQTTQRLSQEALSAPVLRVGDSSATVANTTSSSVTPQANGAADLSWLWLLVPIAVAALLFWPQRRRQASELQATEAALAVPASPPVRQKRTKKRGKKAKKAGRR